MSARPGENSSPGMNATPFSMASSRRVRVSTGRNAQLIEHLRSRELDAVIGRLSDPELMAGLSFESLYAEPMVIVLRPGHPLATAAAVATINAMADEGMVENAAKIGAEVLAPGLAELAAKHRSVGEVRGAGVFWAVELVKDQTSREPLAPYGGTSDAMNAVVTFCKENGLMPFTNFNRIHVVPPCNASDDEVRTGLAILDRALDVADRYAG